MYLATFENVNRYYFVKFATRIEESGEIVGHLREKLNKTTNYQLIKVFI